MPKLSQNERLARLVAETRGKDRFQDLAMVFRRPLITFTTPVRAEQIVIATGVKFRILADAQAGIPVPATSEIIGASAQVPAGAEVSDLAGQAVGRFVPELILSAGGVWDHFLHGWVMDGAERRAASAPLVLDLQESQVAWGRWFATVLLRWRRGEKLDVSAALACGGRRSGKTWLLNMCLWAMILDTPALVDGSAAIGWMVSVSFREYEEIGRQIKEIIPVEWFTFAAAQNKYQIANGGAITNLSARNPQSLRRGKGDVLFLNEAQKMHRRAFVNALPATADRGGLLMLAANPPTEDDIYGEWIYELYDAAAEAKAKGEVPPVLVHDFDWTENRAIDSVARARVAAAIRIVSPEAAEADEQGVVRPVGLRALWAFDRAAHVRPLPPDEEDITEQYTAQHRLLRKAYPYLAGGDFQKSPHNALSMFKIFGTIERPILYVVDVFTIYGDEDDLIDEIEAAGYGTGDVAIIGDSTGGYQDCSHNFASGRTSFSFFQNRKYKILGVREPRDPKSKSGTNPNVARSLTQTNTWIKDGRFFIVEGLDPAIEVAKRCKAKKKDGGLYPADWTHGHVLDTWRYPIYWLTPPKKPTATAPRARAPRLGSNWRERGART